MRTRALMFTAILLTLFGAAFGQDKLKDAGDFVSHGHTEFRGRWYEYHFDSNDLRDSPKWNPEQGEPPISIAQAAKIAENNFGLFVADAEGWEVSSLRLTSAGKNRWYYYVTVSCMTTECLNGSARGFHILILLNGQVLQPKWVEPPAAQIKP